MKFTHKRRAQRKPKEPQRSRSNKQQQQSQGLQASRRTPPTMSIGASRCGDSRADQSRTTSFGSVPRPLSRRVSSPRATLPPP